MDDDRSRRSASTDTDVSRESNAIETTTDVQSTNAISPSALTTGATVLVIAFLLRSGITNTLLVPLCATVLLLNPWVRLFLGLVSVNEEKADDRRGITSFDPIHLVRYLTGSNNHKDEEPNTTREGPQKAQADQKIHLDKSGAYAALRRMPASLRRPLSDLEELIIRDCICSWYNYHSFGDPSLPNEARFSIDYGIGSLFHALEDAKSADVMAELLLAAASVLLVTLRYRRIYPKRPPIFANDAQRIQALREALDRVAARHLRKDDAQCDLMRTLLREIICKQIWNAISGIGEPDFINQQIIQWHERDRNAPAFDLDVGLNNQALQPMSRPEPLQPNTPQSMNVSQRPSPHSSALTSPERGASPVHLRKSGDTSTPAHDMIARSLEEVSSSLPAVATPIVAQTHSGSEPRTTQPRALAMPSPLARSAYSMSSNVTPSLLASTPVMEHPSPSLARDGRKEATRFTSILSADASTLDSPGPSRISKPVFTAAAPAEMGDEVMSAWDEAMPMNVPPTAHQGMQLPESLRKSMRSGPNVSPAEEKQASELNEGYRIAEGLMDSSKDSVISSRLSTGERSSIDSRSSRPISPAVRSSNSSDPSLPKPPSRVPSAASGGIPPAPDMAEVLSNKAASAGYTALRDAFESFLERGGVANRSLFFSPPSAATVAPGEGLALLRLHVGLNAIARLVPAPSEETSGSTSDVNEDYMYRDDALGILQKGFESLTETDEGGIAGRGLREALFIAIQRLDSDRHARIRDVTAPAERALWTRLHGLYEHFWKETCTRPAGTRQPTLGSASTSGNNTPARESFSPEPTMANASWARNSREFRQQLSDFEARGNNIDAGELQYEPRRKLGKSPGVKSTPLPELPLAEADGVTGVGQARAGGEEHDNIGPQLAHLPIGVRKSQGRLQVENGAAAAAALEHGLGIEGGTTNESGLPRKAEAPSFSYQTRDTKTAENVNETTADTKSKGTTPSSTMSSDDLDNFLSCIFAIADEAFSLSGGWTFRRGMLRVFEQIVRTQYWSSLLAVFNDAAQSVTPEQLGKWCTEIKDKFWPDEPSSTNNLGQAAANGHGEQDVAPVETLGEAVVEAAIEAAHSNGESSGNHASVAMAEVKRTQAQRLEAHRKAQAILLSYIPASSAIFMGPGGRQSCQRALICVHEEICQPSTSLDLVLTVVLKMCDIAAR